MTQDRADRVLIVGCGFPQLGLLRAARGLGLYVIGVDANPGAIGASQCDRFVQCSTHDADAIARAVGDEGARGLTTCGSELALTTTARVAEHLELPFYADSKTVERCQSKDLMRAAYREGGAPSPAFLLAAEVGDVQRFASAQGLPLVLKPSRGWGQRGVSKVEREDELASAYERARSASSTGQVLVEEFIDGKEFSVNAYTRNGATVVYSVTERVITSYPDPPGITFAEWFPSGLGREDESAVKNAATLGVRALGITRGPSYTQLRVGPKGPAIVETAHRLGGGLDPDVALLASGTSLFRKILGVALGRPEWEDDGGAFPPSRRVPGLAVEGEKHGGAIGKFLVGRPGRVVSVRGLESAREMPGVVAAEVYVTPGGVVHPLTDGSKRAGHVLAFGKDREDARERASRAAETIVIETVPE
jgi:biotin carboxylase